MQIKETGGRVSKAEALSGGEKMRRPDALHLEFCGEIKNEVEGLGYKMKVPYSFVSKGPPKWGREGTVESQIKQYFKAIPKPEIQHKISQNK